MRLIFDFRRQRIRVRVAEGERPLKDSLRLCEPYLTVVHLEPYLMAKQRCKVRCEETEGEKGRYVKAHPVVPLCLTPLFTRARRAYFTSSPDSLPLCTYFLTFGCASSYPFFTPLGYWVRKQRRSPFRHRTYVRTLKG